MLFFAAFLLLCGGFIWMVRRDLALRLPQAGVSVGGRDEIVLSVESVDMEREIQGRQWHLTAEKLERSPSQARGYTVEISLFDEEGKRWLFTAPQADYRDDLGEVRLLRPRGSLEGENYSIKWSAGEAHWVEGEEGWSLSGGLKIEDSLHGVLLESGWGFFDVDGGVLLREEARLFWQSP